MITIHRFLLEPTSAIIKISLHRGYRILHIGQKPHEIYPSMWVQMDTDKETEFVEFMVWGTGFNMGPMDEWCYLGTALDTQPNLVWHVYKKIDKRQYARPNFVLPSKSLDADVRIPVSDENDA